MSAPDPCSSRGESPASQDLGPDKEIMRGLGRFERLLLVTDGTVTEILEQYLEEKIRLIKLDQKIARDLADIDTAHGRFLAAGDLPVLARQILLQGETSGRNWLHAESTILLNHLGEDFRTDLLASREPIGRLWDKHRVETFKRILDYRRRRADALAGYFGIRPEDPVLSRTYSVTSGRKLIMIICESFLAGSFLDDPERRP